MDGLRIELFDEAGQMREVSDEEFKFLTSPLEKNSLLMVKRLAATRRFGSLSLLLKSKLRKMAGRRPMSAEEKQTLASDFLGFHPKLVRFSLGRLLFNLKFLTSPTSFTTFLLFKEVALLNQYAVSQANMKDKVVVDVGANMGVFSLLAAKLGARRVYAFEPIGEIYRHLKENIELNDAAGVIVPLNKALGEVCESREMSFDEGGGSFFFPNGAKSETVEIVTLDDFMNDKEGLDFIKMDVEGHEESVLLGARNAIGSHKPVLSFSAYHKPTDKQRLPEIVKSIRPDYTCKLNSFAEEVFYCD